MYLPIYLYVCIYIYMDFGGKLPSRAATCSGSSSRLRSARGVEADSGSMAREAEACLATINSFGM